MTLVDPLRLATATAGALVAICLGLVPQAMAQQEFYTIDPTQSFVELRPTTRAQLLFFGLVMTVDVPVQSQVGNGGTGMALPEGGVSDGLRTNLEGQVLVNVSGSTLEIINRRSSVRLVSSGTWLPGPPGDEATPTAGALAAEFGNPSYGFTARGAVRDGVELSFGHAGFASSLTSVGEGVRSFLYNAGDGSTLSPQFAEGVADYETSFAGIDTTGRNGLFLTPAEVPFVNGQGELFEDGKGGRKITIPVSTTAFATDDGFVAGLPFQLAVELEGQIVATNPFFVPEPGLALQALAALGVLGWLRRRRAHRRLLLLGLIVATTPLLMGGRFYAPTSAPRPSFTGFPDCVGTGSSALLTIGGSSQSATGMDACVSPKNPYSADINLSQTQGAVQVDGQATANGIGFVNVFASVVRAAIEWQASIAGGTASPPMNADIVGNFSFPHSGSATGSETLFFGASFETVKSHAGAVAGAASVTLDCGNGAAAVGINGGLMEVAVEAASSCGGKCSCAATLEISGGSVAAAGETVQRLSLFAVAPGNECQVNLSCRDNDPSNPFCVPNFGCSDGSIGMPCEHDSHCDRESGLFCASSGMCEDGIVGDFCSNVGDCALGLDCDTSSTFLCFDPGEGS